LQPYSTLGTLFNAGPGLFERGGHSVRSWLDADGQMTAITFHQGKAHVRTRMIETKEYVEERDADLHLWRGQFGTQAQARAKRGTGNSGPSQGQEASWKARLSLTNMLPTPLVRDAAACERCLTMIPHI
jgi:carotenoid cleavage dioxygenase-like enzyme